MQSTLRASATAAAMLLAATGTLLVAQPAAAQARYIYAQPEFHAQPQHYAPAAVIAQPAIERFVLRHDEALEPGNEVRFRLVGIPGGQAWFQIPGMGRAVALQETRPGVYEADYLIRRRDNADSLARAVATLDSGGQRFQAHVRVRGNAGDGWGRVQTRDHHGPQVEVFAPSQGERGWTRLVARVTDDASGFDPASVVLRIDGRDVTGRVRVNGDSIRYAENLYPGRHVAELMVRDRAGNATQRSWAFDVAHVDRHYGVHSSYGGGYR